MRNYKLLLLAISLLAFASTAVAEKKNDVTRSLHTGKHRQEIIIPKVCGYNVYKADLHTHTIYSDGSVTAPWRLREAWSDGLDILAITDHMEYRRIERNLIKFMGAYIKEEYRHLAKGVNTNIQGVNDKPDERGILVDMNVGYEEALESNEQYGMLVVRGVEITRNQGHYNAIFTKDNNKIYDPDIRKAIKNAVDQGAFVFQNHPKRDANTKTKMTPLAEEVYEKGYVKGTEIGNGHAFWGWLVPHCMNNGLAPISNSDGHATIAERFYPYYNDGAYRNMTLILAKKCDEKSIKEALFAGRTIAYHSNNMVVLMQCITCPCHAKCGRNGGRCMAGIKAIVFALTSAWKTGNTAIRSERVKLIVAAGDQLMRISLVTDIKYDLISRRIENTMQRQSNLNDTQIRGQMSAILGYCLYDFGTNIVRQYFAFFEAQRTNVRRILDLR